MFSSSSVIGSTVRQSSSCKGVDVMGMCGSVIPWLLRLISGITEGKVDAPKNWLVRAAAWAAVRFRSSDAARRCASKVGGGGASIAEDARFFLCETVVGFFCGCLFSAPFWSSTSRSNFLFGLKVCLL